MRLLFRLPDLDRSAWVRGTFALRATGLGVRLLGLPRSTPTVTGGTLNLMRHCMVALSLGADAVLATPSGRDSYGEAWGVGPLPCVPWSDRRPSDVWILPDLYTGFIDHRAPATVVYMQSPEFIHDNFDYHRDDVVIWTDSPFMLGRCQERYPGKEIHLVVNVVDPLAFPFIPQCRRESGLLVAFPRKGATFIRETSRCYQDQGGRFWRFELLDGLPFRRLAEEFRRPQAFLASADVEGCALPPQEAMAAGIVVVGKDASGANFCMRHGETAFVASTPAETAACLREIEDDALRQRLADNAYAYISRFFPWEEPVRTWRRFLASLATLGPAAHRLGSDPTSPSSV